MPLCQISDNVNTSGLYDDPPPREPFPDTAMVMGHAPPEPPRAFSDRPLVYLAAPYAQPDPVANTHDTIMYAEALMAVDDLVTIHVPHLTLLWHAVNPHDAAFWYAFDLAVLAHCDALFRWDNGPSTGADREVEFALDHGLPVFRDEGSLFEWAARR